MNTHRNIYFVRHGQTEANLGKFVQSPDTVLTDTGHLQAKQLAARFINIDLDNILVSPYPRAVDTAKTVAEIKNMNHQIHDDLREWDSPQILWGLLHSDERSKEFSSLMYENWDNPGWAYSDEESPESVIDRAERVLEYIIHETQGDILCVSHGKFLRFLTLLIATKNKNLSIYKESLKGSLVMTNISITHVVIDGDKITLRTFGDSTHLS